MGIVSLGYLGVHSDKTDEWSQFAQKLLGLQQVDKGAGTLSFRMDNYKQRFVVTDESGNNPAFIGWEVETNDDLSFFADKLENAGHEVSFANSGVADQRCVESLIYFNDPDGGVAKSNTVAWFNTKLDGHVPGCVLASNPGGYVQGLG